MKKKEKIFLGLMIITSFFGCIVHGQPLAEELPQENPNYWQQTNQPSWKSDESPEISDIVVLYSPESSNSPEAQELKKQQEQQEQQQTEKECKDGCCGIKLNTNFPIIGNCIETKAGATNPTNAFPQMVGAITKIVLSLIFVVCFILIIVAGIMRAGAGDDNSKSTKAKDILKKVAVTILLLGLSGVILRLINPNFFG